mmetsp:Transcript_17930/g.26536  ORF Transcript_17930/g.26536 Transcript_17930/m.26536 type:complete len:187 (+) Transcript_17930:185-745(+)|eukprot:CAMPEP_0194199532 /NCGR_PEP_ID=MMETSP0156-20130528/520_1 /TAXON_ID=33649 /ORGANISM="Thalassionema nitzschioides, Strain L26-B" /LENGTH=186 /DNA_ID=CAMNT_0038924443 /DNA_START=145 /DNA_END=705 /DNA_ORIENTATION=-
MTSLLSVLLMIFLPLFDPTTASFADHNFGDPSYDDLLNCMWNGTTVATCHQVAVTSGCVWCHSAYSNICVTKEYAENLDGSVFRCETHHDTDDNVPSADDDLATDDDDPGHENEKYFDHLSQCMNGYDNPSDCNSADLSFHCQWCFDSSGGICLSKQAAQNVDGSYFDCNSDFVDDGDWEGRTSDS